MFTNQKILGMVLILFIIGAAAYFAYIKFKAELGQVSSSPSPSPTPSDLTFIFMQTPSPAPASGQQQLQPQPSPAELPLAKNKRLSQFPGILKPEILQNKKAVIQTKKGIIQFEIYPEATMAASNFMVLGANGFYDGLIFHRVEDWVIQGGDPLGDGTGGPGYQFQDEPVTRDYTKGIVAMANAGPDTNGSQFFILKTDYPLPPSYTIFGNVISGQEVVDKISVGDVMERVVIQNLQ